MCVIHALRTHTHLEPLRVMSLACHCAHSELSLKGMSSLCRPISDRMVATLIIDVKNETIKGVR